MPTPIRDRDEELAARERYLARRRERLPQLLELHERLAAGETLADVVREAALAAVRKSS